MRLPIGFSSIFLAGFGYATHSAYSYSSEAYHKGNADLRKVFELMHPGENPNEDQLSNFLASIKRMYKNPDDFQELIDKYEQAVAQAVAPKTRTWDAQEVDEKFNTITVTKSETTIPLPHETLETADEFFGLSILSAVMTCLAATAVVSKFGEWQRRR